MDLLGAVLGAHRGGGTGGGATSGGSRRTSNCAGGGCGIVVAADVVAEGAVAEGAGEDGLQQLQADLVVHVHAGGSSGGEHQPLSPLAQQEEQQRALDSALLGLAPQPQQQGEPSKSCTDPPTAGAVVVVGGSCSVAQLRNLAALEEGATAATSVCGSVSSDQHRLVGAVFAGRSPALLMRGGAVRSALVLPRAV
jgi:uncharacterized protein YgbK (DUF1537 family)